MSQIVSENPAKKSQKRKHRSLQARMQRRENRSIRKREQRVLYSKKGKNYAQLAQVHDSYILEAQEARYPEYKTKHKQIAEHNEYILNITQHADNGYGIAKFLYEEEIKQRRLEFQSDVRT